MLVISEDCEDIGFGILWTSGGGVLRIVIGRLRVFFESVSLDSFLVLPPVCLALCSVSRLTAVQYYCCGSVPV